MIRDAPQIADYHVGTGNDRKFWAALSVNNPADQLTDGVTNART